MESVAVFGMGLADPFSTKESEKGYVNTCVVIAVLSGEFPIILFPSKMVNVVNVISHEYEEYANLPVIPVEPVGPMSPDRPIGPVEPI